MSEAWKLAPASQEWVVHIQGMDDVLPTLGRRDAYVRAQKANDAAVHIEIFPGPGRVPEHRPVTWAFPKRVERSPFPPEMTAADVEAGWREWLG